MARCQIGEKPLPESMVGLFTDAFNIDLIKIKLLKKDWILVIWIRKQILGNKTIWRVRSKSYSSKPIS